MIQANQAETAVRTMCAVLGVSKSGYYEWCRPAASKRALENERLSRRIGEIHAASDSTYGMPKIWHELRDVGDARFDPSWARVGRKRVARLMRAAACARYWPAPACTARSNCSSCR